MKHIIIISIIALFLSPTTNFAGNDSLILMFPASARATAMGEAYSSLVDDASALSYNPAGLGNIKSMSANYSYMSYIFGQQYHNIAGAYRAEGLGVFALGLSFLGTEEFKLTSDAGETDTLVDSSSWFINTGYCYEFKNNIFIGANFKYIKEAYYIDNESMTSEGMGLGIGILTENLLIKDLGLSCVIKNIGFKSAYNDGTEGSMPFEAVLGSKYHHRLSKPCGVYERLLSDVRHCN